MPRGSSERNLTSAAFHCGDWLVDPSLSRISRHGECVNLELRVMDLFVLLARNAPKMVKKQDIMDAVWDADFVAENSLTHTISQLRSALGDSARDPEYIETIHRLGYRLVKPVRPAAHQPAVAATEIESCRYRVLVGRTGISLKQGENLIGRSPDATVTIDSLAVSRRHALILVDGQTAILEDLGSKNGTHLNGQRVIGQSVLEHGDQILLGDHSAVLRFAESDETETPSEPPGRQISTVP